MEADRIRQRKKPGRKRIQSTARRREDRPGVAAEQDLVAAILVSAVAKNSVA